MGKGAGTSSARPSDLEAFAKGSQGLDGALRDAHIELRQAYDAFQRANRWGEFEALSLIDAAGRYVRGNRFTRKWVTEIAHQFRIAGGGGRIKRLSDKAIKASLKAAYLDHGRSSVTFDDPMAWGDVPTTGYSNDPVNTATGNFVEVEHDLVCGGLVAGLSFERTYNSRSDRVGPFGRGWSSWASVALRARPDGAEFVGPDGQEVLIPRMGDGYGRVAELPALVETLDSGLALRWLGSVRRWEFDEAGRLVSTTRGPGTAIALHHDDDGRLAELAHTGGKRVRLEWDAGTERIAAVHCSDGRSVTYAYDDEQNLIEADGVDGLRCYELDDIGRVRSVMDADGVLEAVNTYDDDGRVLEQLSPHGRRTYLTYLPGRVTVTMDDDEHGPVNTYVHDAFGRLTTIVDGDDSQMSLGYDDWGYPATVTERNGTVTFQEYNEQGRIVRRVLPTGLSFEFSWDAADRLVQVAASSGAVTRLRYEGDERIPVAVIDAEGGVTRASVAGGLVRAVTDADGVSTELEYDADGNLVSTTNADGGVSRLERHEAGQIIAAVSPLGRRTTSRYDAAGRLIERRDPAGGVWRLEYSATGRLRRLTDPSGACQELTYGEHGSPAAVLDALGRVTSAEYDTFGNVIGVVEPGGAAWRFTYDAFMQLTATVDPAGARWEREYDVTGELTATVDPTGVRATATRDPFGRVIGVGDGLTTEGFELDELGQVRARIRADGSRVAIEYDLCGRPTMFEDELGATTRLEYTPAGRVARCVRPSGRVETIEYDACGRVTARIDGAGRRWESRYDADDNISQVQLPTGEIERYEYDEAGRLSSTAAPGAGTTTCAYDAVGRIVLLADRDAGERRFAYDGVGRVVEASDANGGRTICAYDECGRLTQITDPLGGVATGSYDAVGRITALADQLGRTTSLSYDAAGRLLEQVDGSGRAVRRAYDAAGRLTAIGPAGGGPTTIEYDALGRVVSVREPGAPANTLGWDGAGRLVERCRGERAMRWDYGVDGERLAIGYPDGTQTTYAHDAGGYVIAARHPALGMVELERDAAGRLVGATADGMQARWSYENGDLLRYEARAGDRLRTAHLIRDPIGRIVRATIDGGSHEFAFDATGQLVEADTPLGAYAFHYDANGRLTREASPAGVAEYAYDGAAQLSKRAVAGGAETHYEYDGAGRRVRESGAGVDRAYRWDDLGRLAEVADGGDEQPHTIEIVVDALGELASLDGREMLWDTADPLQPLAWNGEGAVVGEGGPWATASGDAAHWLVPDWQGTVGASPRDPWGAPVSGFDMPAFGLGFRGEVEFGADTWLRHRVYQPGSRAFLQRDPLPPVPGSAVSGNPYHYATNNAIGLADPLGLNPVSPAELKKLRDRMDRGVIDEVVDHAGEAAAVLAVVAWFVPVPGLNVVLGIAALTLAGVSAKKSYDDGDYVAVGLDIAGAIPGGGAVFKGIKGIRAGSKATRIDAASDAIRANARNATQKLDNMESFAKGQRRLADEMSDTAGAGYQARDRLEAATKYLDKRSLALTPPGLLWNWGRDIHEDGGLNIPFKRDPLGAGPLAPALGYKRPTIGGYEP